MPRNDKTRSAAVKPVLPSVITAPQGHDAAAFLKEVDDALHEDKLLALWKVWRWPLVVAVTLLILGTAGWQGWQAYVRHTDRTVAEAWYAFTKLETPEARREALPALLASSQGGYRALAAFTMAEDLAGKDPKAADRAYGQVYNSRSYPQWLRDLARFNAALTLLGNDDTLAQEHLNVLVQTGSVDKPNELSPLYAPALDVLALMAEKKGDAPTARGYTEKLLAIPTIPDALRARAMARFGNLTTLAH